MLAKLPYILRVLLNLPHPLELVWLVWLILLPWQIRYLFRRNPDPEQLRKTGELMNFREIAAVGCIGGFILLTFIFAYTSYITLSLNGLI